MFKKTQETVKTGVKQLSLSTMFVAVAVALISVLLFVNTITMVKVAYL